MTDPVGLPFCDSSTVTNKMDQLQYPSVQYHFRENLSSPSVENKNNDQTSHGDRPFHSSVSNIFDKEIISISQSMKDKFESELPFFGYLGNRVKTCKAISLEMGTITTSSTKVKESDLKPFIQPLVITKSHAIQNHTSTNDTTGSIRKQGMEMDSNLIRVLYPNMELEMKASLPMPPSNAHVDNYTQSIATQTNEILGGDDECEQNGIKNSSLEIQKIKCANKLKQAHKPQRPIKPQTILTPRTSTGLIPTSFKSSIDKTSLSWTPLPPRPPPETFPYKGKPGTTKKRHRKEKGHKRSKSMPTLATSSGPETNLKRKRYVKKDGIQKYDLCSPKQTFKLPKRRSPPLPKKKRDNALILQKLNKMQNSPSKEKILTKASILKQKEDHWISSLHDGSVYRLSLMEKKIKDDLRVESKSFIRNSALEREEKRKKKQHSLEQNKDRNHKFNKAKSPISQHKNDNAPTLIENSSRTTKLKVQGVRKIKKPLIQKNKIQDFSSYQTNKNKGEDMPNDRSVVRKMTKRIVTLEKKLAMLGIDIVEEEEEVEITDKKGHLRRPFRLINGPNIEHIGNLQIDSALMESPTNTEYQSNKNESANTQRRLSKCLFHSPAKESLLEVKASVHSPLSIIGSDEDIPVQPVVDNMSCANNPSTKYYSSPQDKTKEAIEAMKIEYCTSIQSSFANSPHLTEEVPIASNLSISFGCKEDWISPYS